MDTLRRWRAAAANFRRRSLSAAQRSTAGIQRNSAADHRRHSTASCGKCDVQTTAWGRVPLVEVCSSEVDPSEECAVCLAEMGATVETVLKLPCGHMFHSECLRAWFERQPTCPMCRHDCVPGVRQGRGPPPQRLAAPRNCDDVDWRLLTPLEQSAARLLGYTPTSWDNDSRVPSERLSWRQLSQAQRDAWTRLGWNRQRWG